jgi:RNA polymerase sigma-70 factor (ECF subfamily)
VQYGSFLRQVIVRFAPGRLGIAVDDIEQEARLRLWRAFERETETADVASYLYRIAASATIDAIRRVKARREETAGLLDGADDDAAPAIDVPRAADTPEERARRREVRQAIERALGKLAEDRRRAVALHLRGFSTREIGTLLGWTEPRARNLAYRGLADLREELRAMGVGHDAGR